MNKKKIIKSMLIIVFICIFNLFFMNHSSLAATTGKINVETARLRREANANSEIVELISLNEEVEILQQAGEWYQIKYKDVTGYLRNDLVTVNENTGENVTNTNATSTENQESNQVENEVPTDMYGKKKIVEDTKLKIVPAINATDIIDVKQNDETSEK